MTFFSPSRHATCRPARTPLSGTLGHLFGVWRQRRALRRLDAQALEDIGLTRTQADAEARRPFWDAPDTWRR